MTETSFKIFLEPFLTADPYQAKLEARLQSELDALSSDEERRKAIAQMQAAQAREDRAYYGLEPLALNTRTRRSKRKKYFWDPI